MKKITVVCNGKKRTFTIKTDKKTITVWTLGDEKRGYYPGQAQFDEFREKLKKAYEDPEYQIIVPYFVKVKIVPV